MSFAGCVICLVGSTLFKEDVELEVMEYMCVFVGISAKVANYQPV